MTFASCLLQCCLFVVVSSVHCRLFSRSIIAATPQNDQRVIVAVSLAVILVTTIATYLLYVLYFSRPAHTPHRVVFERSFLLLF